MKGKIWNFFADLWFKYKGKGQVNGTISFLCWPFIFKLLYINVNFKHKIHFKQKMEILLFENVETTPIVFF